MCSEKRDLNGDDVITIRNGRKILAFTARTLAAWLGVATHTVNMWELYERRPDNPNGRRPPKKYLELVGELVEIKNQFFAEAKAQGGKKE